MISKEKKTAIMKDAILFKVNLSPYSETGVSDHLLISGD